MSGSIRISRDYDAPVELVWECVATSEGLAAWLMPNDFAPVVGHRFTFTDRPRRPMFDGIVGCEVRELEPMRLVSFSWTGGPVDTVVTFELAVLGPGRTRLTLTQTGFTGLRASLVRSLLDLGWRNLLRRRLPGRLARA